jgi:hypothetical protein
MRESKGSNISQASQITSNEDEMLPNRLNKYASIVAILESHQR